MNGSGTLYDANVWLALAFADHPHHSVALATYQTATDVAPAFFCRSTQQTFLRIASNPAFLKLCNATGLTNRDAAILLEKFMASSVIACYEEPAAITPLWYRLGARDTASPKVWMDAYLAAFAILADVEFATFDHGFNAFQNEGLKLVLLHPSP